MSTDKYIDIEQVIADKNQALARWLPGFALRYIQKIVHEKDINETMAAVGHLQGLAFVDGVMDHLNIEVKVKGAENVPREGGCIIAANHPLGGLDGIAFMKAVGTIRPDIKFLVNDILLNIENFQPLFLPVNKHGTNARKALKLIEEAYASEQAVLVFPAGLVSRKLPGGVADLEWKKSFITKALKYRKPVIPTFIDGKNSSFFYNLSRWRSRLGVKANLEMFYLADEMFRQRNKSITVTFGEAIPCTIFEDSRNAEEWAKYVRKKVYSLANE